MPDYAPPTEGVTTPPAEPDAGDVEALAKVIRSATAYYSRPGRGIVALTTAQAEAVFASDWLDAVRRKAGDERAEQIAQAIEADSERAGHSICECDQRRAARVARESR